MSEIAAGPDVVEVEKFYTTAPERVWHALTTPESMARWLMEPTGFEPMVGTRFTFRTDPITATGFSGEIACEVITVTTGEQIAYTWADARSDRPSHWVVAWVVHAEGVGTRVMLRHSGFDPDDETEQLSRTIMSKGWAQIVARLGDLLND
jgi:uncharacterized protein YndB with AHSA1/START domain